MKLKLFLSLSLATALCFYGCTKTVYVIETPNSSENPVLPELEDVDDVCTKMTDENFKEYCYENFDADNDGKVSMKEAKKVTEIDCSTAEDFAGIEYFSNLQSFTSTSVKYIDLRYNLELTQVDMRRSPVNRLDLSYNTKLDSLAEKAFYRCTDLASVTFPKSLTSIGDDAFGYCSSLASITLPESLETIGSDAFENCSSLSSITLPESVTSIGSGAFFNCTKLTSIVLPENLTSIGDDAFGQCSSLASITLPESLETIGSRAFENCSSLTSIALPKGVTIVSDYTFYRCTGLTLVDIPESLISIGESAFDGCSSLASITLPESLETIGSQAFGYCSSLTSIVLPKGVTAISDYTFYRCTGLTSVDLSEGLATIEDYAFSECTKLGAVSIKAIPPPSIGDRVFFLNIFLSTLYVPEECVDVYRNSDWAKWFFQILPMDDTFENSGPYDDDFSNHDGDGTKENPYSVSQAVEMIDNGTYDPDKGYYVKGFVYNNGSFGVSNEWACYISDEYLRLYVEGYVEEPLTSYDGLAGGDKVIVYGRFSIFDPIIVGAKIYYWNGVITEVEEE